MEIYIVRHTTPDVEKGICYGQSNIGVTKGFKNEVIEVKKELPCGSDYKVYSSPLLRCYQLATEIGNPVFTDSRLKELNFGTWENTAWDNIPKNEIDPWMNDFVSEKPPEGETYIKLQKRVIDFFESIIEKNNQTDTLIIVTHAGPMRAWLSHIQKIDLKDSFNIKVNYGQVFKIEYVNNIFTIVNRSGL